jgi:hypothetical protein
LNNDPSKVRIDLVCKGLQLVIVLRRAGCEPPRKQDHLRVGVERVKELQLSLVGIHKVADMLKKYKICLLLVSLSPVLFL